MPLSFVFDIRVVVYGATCNAKAVARPYNIIDNMTGNLPCIMYVFIISLFNYAFFSFFILPANDCPELYIDMSVSDFIITVYTCIEPLRPSHTEWRFIH